MGKVEEMAVKARQPGRPRAIPEDIVPVVIDLWKHGYGYRAIAHVLNSPEYGLNPHYSSVRQALIRAGEVKRR